MKVLSVAMALAAVLVSAGCASTKDPGVLDGDMLVERDGLWYEIDSEEPFTGKTAEYWPGGEKMMEGELVDGRVDGKVTEWYEEGEKKSETEYRGGELHGKAVGWYENGQKQAEVEFSDGEEVGRQEWDEDGNPISQ
jgi:antitoxin component YwqK of YwqJK toxin-antitoxin module